jgi:hypothetical protein
MRMPAWWDSARTPVAFLVAPLAVPLIFALYMQWPRSDLATSLAIVFSAFVAYAGTLIFGLPLYLFLRAQNATAFVIAPPFGFVVGPS